MTHKNKTEFREVEFRFSEGDGYEGPGRVQGVLLPLGRVASDRQEIFAPGSVRFPAGGVRLLREHSGPVVMTFDPVLTETEVRIDAALPSTEIGRTLAAEIRSGERASLSVEFVATQERSTSGVREITAAFIDSVATVKAGSYSQARAEVRSRKRRRWR